MYLHIFLCVFIRFLHQFAVHPHRKSRNLPCRETVRQNCQAKLSACDGRLCACKDPKPFNPEGALWLYPNSMKSYPLPSVVALFFPPVKSDGGTRSAWDYGPLGVALKDNIKREWWRSMVVTRGDVVGVDTSIILPTPVWVASGHVAVFNDPLVECLNCHKRQRSDKLEESYAEKHGDKLPENGMADIVCPDCGTRGKWTEPRDFNMMLRTHLGPVEDENSLHYLRPETAQGIFVDFKNVMTSSRKKPPFGIANMGKSFRNEITPGNFIFRTREFEQMEMEFFVQARRRTKPGTSTGSTPAPSGTSTSASSRRTCATTSIRRRSWLALFEAHRRHRIQVRLPGLRLGRARRHRQPYRLRPVRARGALRRGPELLQPGHRREVRAVRHRAGRRPDPFPHVPSSSTPTTWTRLRTPRAAWTSAPCCTSTRVWLRSRPPCCR